VEPPNTPHGLRIFTIVPCRGDVQIEAEFGDFRGDGPGAGLILYRTFPSWTLAFGMTFAPKPWKTLRL
jgi:hypothetical protein